MRAHALTAVAKPDGDKVLYRHVLRFRMLFAMSIEPIKKTDRYQAGEQSERANSDDRHDAAQQPGIDEKTAG